MPSKDSDNLFNFILKYFQVFLQKISLSLHLFFRNELFNHAGAAAFFFILSIPPVFLLLLIAFDLYLVSYADASVIFFEFIKNINENLDKDLFAKIGLLNVDTTAIGIFGLLNLLWVGRAIITSIQRGLRIIFPAAKKRTPLKMNIVSFIILSILLLASVLITFLSISLNFVQTLLPESVIIQTFFQALLPVLRHFFPFVIIAVLIFMAYRLVPPDKPQTTSCLISATGCALSIFLVHFLFAKFFTVTQYSVIYGVLGSLILMVLWVYFSFLLFFFFAEYTFVSDKLDVLVFEQMYLFRFSHSVKEKKIQKFLFNHPQRIFEKYARRYKAGEILFREGDQGAHIYFVDQGSIKIFRKIGGHDQEIATVRAGRVFGEMAYLLNQSRTATAIAATESILLIIMPDVFEELLQANTIFSRNIIQVLCNRLRRTHFAERP